MGNNNSSSGRIGIGYLLLVAFIVLKLCGVITRSWWWVLCPAWIGAAIWIIAAISLLFIGDVGQKKVTKRAPMPSKWEQRLKEMQDKQREINNKRPA